MSCIFQLVHQNQNLRSQSKPIPLEPQWHQKTFPQGVTHSSQRGEETPQLCWSCHPPCRRPAKLHIQYRLSYRALKTHQRYHSWFLSVFRPEMPAMPAASKLLSSLCHFLLNVEKEDGLAFYQCLALRCHQVHCQGEVFREGKFPWKKKKRLQLPLHIVRPYSET